MKNVYVCVRVCECVGVGVRVCQGVKTERERPEARVTEYGSA